MNNKISVVIPAYNIEGHLTRTLESVLSQSHENLEIIVVNDGSTDNTGAIIDSFAEKDKRIVAIHKENGGVTSARLRGIKAATGDFIGFVDGDDFIEADMYSRLLDNLECYDADISHCGYRMVFPSRTDYYYNSGRLVVQEGKQGCTDLLNGTFVEPALWNKLYRRELFEGLDEWMDKTVRINEDLLMNFYLFRNARKAVFEDICPYHYILRKGSAATSRLNAHKLRDPIQVLHIMENEAKDESEWSSILKGRLAYALVGLSTISYSGQKALIKPYRAAARKELRQRLKEILRSNFSSKLKLMALWAALWPWSYGFVHRVYAKITGVDKKYEVK